MAYTLPSVSPPTTRPRTTTPAVGQTAYQASRPAPAAVAPVTIAPATTPMYSASTSGTALRTATSPPASTQLSQMSSDGYSATPGSTLAAQVRAMSQAAESSAMRTPVPAATPAPTAPTPSGAGTTAPVSGAGTTTSSPASEALRTLQTQNGETFHPELVSLGDGQYSVTRPNTWSPEEERVLTDHQTELQGIQDSISRPGTDPGIISQAQARIDWLKGEVDNATARKTALASAGQFGQYSPDMTEQEYEESILTNPAFGENQVSAARRALGLNTQRQVDQEKAAAMKTAEAQNHQTDIDERNDRGRLMNQLALRGLDPEHDSWAQGQLNELSDKYRAVREAQQAQAMVASSAADDKTKAYLTSLADKRLKAAETARKDLLDKQKADADRAKTVGNLDIAQQKLKAKELYDNKMIDLKTAVAMGYDPSTGEETVSGRAQSTKEDIAPSTIAKNEGSAANANANATYTSGAKTANTEANTAYTAGAKTDLTKAQTTRINTLLPAELARMQAQTAKLRVVKGGTGGGGATHMTPDEVEAVARLNGGKAPTSEKMLATLLNQVRTVHGNVDSLVEVSNQAAATRQATVHPKTAVGNIFGSSAPKPTAPKPAAKTPTVDKIF